MRDSPNVQVIGALRKAHEEGDLEASFKDLSPELARVECEGFPTPGVLRDRREILESRLFAALR